MSDKALQQIGMIVWRSCINLAWCSASGL